MDESDANTDPFLEMPKMTDSELASRLREMNFDIGPVNAFTRSVYARKLERLLLEQTCLEHVIIPRAYPEKRETEEMKSCEAHPSSSQEIDLVLEDTSVSTDGSSIDDRERSLLQSPDAAAAAVMMSAKEEIVAAAVAESDKAKMVKHLPTEYKDRDAPSASPRGKQKPPLVGLGSFSGVSSSTPLAGSLSGGTSERRNDVVHLRQRTAVSNSHHDRDVKSNKSFDRSAALRPEDCVPSPRTPLPTYLQRLAISTPPGSNDSVPAPTPETIPPKTPPASSSWLKNLVALIVVFFILLTVLFVFLTMEPGYISPL